MMRSCGGSGRRRGLRVGTVSLALLALAGCSVPDALNPVSWYRDLSGVSKNDALDNTPKNKQNLEAGSKEPYPNLADVPDAPSNALSTIDRDKLQQSLVADRENAKYSADALRAGTAASGIVPSPPPPAPAAIALPQRAVPGAPQAAAAPKPAAATAAAEAAARARRRRAHSPARDADRLARLRRAPRRTGLLAGAGRRQLRRRLRGPERRRPDAPQRDRRVAPSARRRDSRDRPREADRGAGSDAAAARQLHPGVEPRPRSGAGAGRRRRAGERDRGRGGAEPRRRCRRVERRDLPRALIPSRAAMDEPLL